MGKLSIGDVVRLKIDPKQIENSQLQKIFTERGITKGTTASVTKVIGDEVKLYFLYIEDDSIIQAPSSLFEKAT